MKAERCHQDRDAGEVFAAEMAAATRSMPLSCSCFFANSTIKMAFFDANPIRTTNPICVRTLLSSLAMMTPDNCRQQTHWERSESPPAAGSSFRTAPRATRKTNKDGEHKGDDRGIAGLFFLIGDFRPLESRCHRADTCAANVLPF
jgi:hypothetical protein